MMEIHVEAAGAVHNFAVLAHFLAVEGQHFVRGIITLVIDRDHLQAKQRAGDIHIGAVVTVVVIILLPPVRRDKARGRYPSRQKHFLSR